MENGTVRQRSGESEDLGLRRQEFVAAGRFSIQGTPHLPVHRKADCRVCSMGLPCGFGLWEIWNVRNLGVSKTRGP